MRFGKPRLRFHGGKFRGGQLAHKNNKYFTPQKLPLYGTQQVPTTKKLDTKQHHTIIVATLQQSKYQWERINITL